MSVTVPMTGRVLQNWRRDAGTGTSRARFARNLHIASALSALVLAPGLSGCILGSERPDLNLDVPATYREASRGAPDAALPAVDWWRGFRSGELKMLMEAAQI